MADWQDGGSRRRCQPYPLFSLTWLEVCLFLEAPSVRLLSGLGVHVSRQCDLKAQVPIHGFLSELVVSPPSCSECQALGVWTCLPFLLLFSYNAVSNAVCGKAFPGTADQLLCRIAAVSKSVPLVQVLANPSLSSC